MAPRPKNTAMKRHRYDQRQLPAVAMHIVLDHDLHAELAVMQADADGQDQQHHDERRADPGAHHAVVGAAQHHERDGEPHDERDQRDGGEPLRPPVMHAVLGRTEAAGAGERRSAIVHVIGLPQTSLRPTIHDSDRGDQRDGDDDPAAAIGVLELEAVARIPEQVPDAVAQVIEGAEQPAAQHDAAQRSRC